MTEGVDDAHRRTVGQVDHDQALAAVGLEAAHIALDVVAVSGRPGEPDVDRIGQAFRHLPGIVLLALRDPGKHVVVKLLHDPQQSDYRLL